MTETEKKNYRIVRVDYQQGHYFKIEKRFKLLWFIPLWYDPHGDDCVSFSTIQAAERHIQEGCPNQNYETIIK